MTTKRVGILAEFNYEDLEVRIQLLCVAAITFSFAFYHSEIYCAAELPYYRCLTAWSKYAVYFHFCQLAFLKLQDPV